MAVTCAGHPGVRVRSKRRSAMPAGDDDVPLTRSRACPKLVGAGASSCTTGPGASCRKASGGLRNEKVRGSNPTQLHSVISKIWTRRTPGSVSGFGFWFGSGWSSERLVDAAGVEGEVAEEFSGDGVDYPYVDSVNEFHTSRACTYMSAFSNRTWSKQDDASRAKSRQVNTLGAFPMASPVHRLTESRLPRRTFDWRCEPAGRQIRRCPGISLSSNGAREGRVECCMGGLTSEHDGPGATTCY